MALFFDRIIIYTAGMVGIFYIVRGLRMIIFIIVDFDNKDRCKVRNKQYIDHKVKRIRSEVIHVFFVG